MINQIKDYFLTLQQSLCADLEQQESSQSNSKFISDQWEHIQGGGGLTRVLTGQVLEKAGVNFSHVQGDALPKAATLQRPELHGCSFQAMGVSSVIHPFNPFVPTAHLNVRYFEATKPNGEKIWWFGGGFDLTPYYGFIEDCKHFHQTAKNACTPFDDSYYPKFKKWADEYFYLKHRNEPRGIGGLFFDDINYPDLDSTFAFVRSVGDHFSKAYCPIIERRKNTEYTNEHKNFQLYRRGRYVEFNLVFDRGTLFGLQSGGRTESILMSLPPEVKWGYQISPVANTPESELLNFYLQPKDWLSV